MINFYTDGSTRGNPGEGGYGVVWLDDKDIYYAYSKQVPYTTNNRMELSAIIHVFKEFGHKDMDITIYTDSAYCCNMINDWIWRWAVNDWCNSKGREVENLDLVKELYEYLKQYNNMRVIHVKGHKGLIGNELADALATDNIVKYKTLIKKNALEENYNFVSTREA